jgi:hypothetical protein
MEAAKEPRLEVTREAPEARLEAAAPPRGADSASLGTEAMEGAEAEDENSEAREGVEEAAGAAAPMLPTGWLTSATWRAANHSEKEGTLGEAIRG